MAMPASSPVVVVLAALCCLLLLCADASVHDYTGESFAALGNAFVLNGGSEGVYASPAADSFIRYVCKSNARLKPEPAARSYTVCVDFVIAISFLAWISSRGGVTGACVRGVQIREGRVQEDAGVGGRGR
jgi:hypothetical protein